MNYRIYLQKYIYKIIIHIIKLILISRDSKSIRYIILMTFCSIRRKNATNIFWPADDVAFVTSAWVVFFLCGGKPFFFIKMGVIEFTKFEYLAHAGVKLFLINGPDKFMAL